MCALATPDDPDKLAFRIDDGPTQNAFLRRGPIAVHLAVSSGRAPRIVAAFPAGNAGAGLWFEPLRRASTLAIERAPEPVIREDGLRGISAGLACDASELHLHAAVLGGVRAVRRFPRTGEIPGYRTATVRERPRRDSILLQRTTLAGRRVALTITPEGRAAVRADGDRVVLRANGGPLRFSVTALTDDPPLRAIAPRDLLRPGVDADPSLLAALAFLSYEDRILAGSWRFLTYFGRDTLLSLRLLQDVLQPAVMEAGLGAVLDRLSEGGSVAHEEAVGEEAASHHVAAGRPAELDAPVLDHGMIDDDFLLAPVAAEHLLAADPERARAFLGRRTPAGQTYAAALAGNLSLVAQRAARFVEAPVPASLVALADGKRAGDWRDSTDGLGGGRIPFGVNAALVPAALRAAARLHASPLLGGDAASAARARGFAGAWGRAADLFRVTIPREEARRRLGLYGVAIDVDPGPAIAAVRGDVTFPAIALDEAGAPIEVMSSDDGFVLLFGDPPAAALDEAAARLLAPFPAGLATPAGMVVANPAFAADPGLFSRFTSAHYHGTVVWPFQHALYAAGLDRQLARRDLPPPTRARLASARAAVGDVMRATRAFGSAELWTIAHQDGRFEHFPFGAAGAHHTESNAAQLWSTVQLAMRS